MAFSDLLFLFFFLPLTLAAYFLTPKRHRITVLFAASLVWFAFSDTLYLPLLLGAILIYYLAGRLISHWQEKPGQRRVVFWGALGLNLGILLIFKFHLFSDLYLSTPLNAMAVPLGISVYQLQGISYLKDLYQGKVKVQKNFVRLGVGMAFFPTAVCGPITPYGEMQRQLRFTTPDSTRIARGYHLFVRGLVKKLLFADTLINGWETIQSLGSQQLSALTAWTGAFCFAFGFTYFLSGYADMGRGLARIFGMTLPVNFRQPFAAKSVVEFWRRFNLSLSGWITRYAIPKIGGGKEDRLLYLSACLKMLILWLCMGLWYGNHLLWLLWGLWICFFILLETTFLSSLLAKLPGLVRRIYTLLVLLVGFVILSAPNAVQMANYLGAMFGATGLLADEAGWFCLSHYWPILLLAAFCSGSFWHKFYLWSLRRFPTLSRIGLGVAQTLGLLGFLLYLLSAHTDPCLNLMRF